MLEFDIIVAVDKNFGIGKSGQMPWHLSADLKHFRTLTSSASPGKINAVIMGRVTWESLPQRYRPLQNRINLVLSRHGEIALAENVLKSDSLENALILLNDKHREKLGNVFVIGGSQVYNTALDSPSCQNIYMTEIHKDFKCDTFFPKKLAGFKSVFQSPLQAENGIQFRFTQWTQNPH